MTATEIRAGRVYLGHDGVCRRVERLAKFGNRILVRRLSLPPRGPVWTPRDRFARAAAREVHVPELERIVDEASPRQQEPAHA